MCAISGIIGHENFCVDGLKLKEISDRMILRGPDSGDYYIDRNIGLAHRRLSIIDLSTGDQPMTIDNGNVVIVYNGEVYNYQEIRNELIGKGCAFKTTSDTEVVAMAYQFFGIEECLKRLEGMFAFTIYDKNKGKIYIARDRFGEKPLYYYTEEGVFYFASELKAFAPSLERFKISKTALNLFLTLSYIPAPYTIYDGISKLLPGHYMEFDRRDTYHIKQYFEAKEDIAQKDKTDYQTSINTLKELLSTSVKQRMVSDVPMGAFLSGGIDSSIICCLMSRLSDEPINTFSIGFEEKDCDESERAEIVAKHIGANHRKYILRYNDVLDILDEIISYYDEPFGDSSAIPSYYVAKLASKDVKVVLTGDCADELFAGYEKYLAEYYVSKYKKVPKPLRALFEWIVAKVPINNYTNNTLRKLKKVIQYSNESGFDLYYDMLCLGFNDSKRACVLKKGWYCDVRQIYKKYFEDLPKGSTFLQREQLLDIYRVLEGQMFPKVDRACMHNSLENRAPFIDSAIVRFALNLPDTFKMNGKDKKRILKEAFEDILPPETLKFNKHGFDVPVDRWFKRELKSELESLLCKEFIERQGIFDYSFVENLISEHIAGRENHKGMLWNLYVFQKWFLKNESRE